MYNNFADSQISRLADTHISTRRINLTFEFFSGTLRNVMFMVVTKCIFIPMLRMTHSDMKSRQVFTYNNAKMSEYDICIYFLSYSDI